MKNYILAVLLAGPLAGHAFAASGAIFDSYNYNLCKARGITAVGVATQARDRHEPVEDALSRLKPPTVMDMKLALLADEYIRAGFPVSEERSLDDLGHFLTGVCYQAPIAGRN